MSDQIAHLKSGGLIRNYGLRWDRHLVSFRRPVSVQGYWSDDKAKEPVEFAKQTGVYALYDGPELVYVGRAVKGERPLGERLRWHHNDASKTDRWNTFSWFGFRNVNKTTNELQAEFNSVRQVNTAAVAEVFEGLMIEFIRPRLNNRGGDLSNVSKFIQLRPKKTDEK